MFKGMFYIRINNIDFFHFQEINLNPFMCFENPNVFLLEIGGLIYISGK